MTTNANGNNARHDKRPDAFNAPKSRSKLSRSLAATGAFVHRLTRLPLLGDVVTGGLRRFNKGASLFLWVALLGFAGVSAARAAEKNWQGLGVGGAGSQLSGTLTRAQNWVGGSAPNINDTASISINGGSFTSSAGLTQTSGANIEWGHLFFTTRLGTSRGTITLNQNNYFGSITAGGLNTIVLNGGSTSVGANFQSGNGTNPFHLVLVNGSLTIGGVLTNSAAGWIANSNNNDNVTTIIGNVVQNSGASFQFGTQLTSGSDPIMRILGVFTNSSGATLFNNPSQSGNNEHVSSRFEISNLISNAGVLLIRASSGGGGGGNAHSQTTTFAVTSGDFFNSGVTTLTANSDGAAHVARGTLSVSGIFTNTGFFDMRPETGNSAFLNLLVGNLHLASTGVIRANNAGTITLTANGAASLPIFANRIASGNGAQFSLGTTTVVITGDGDSSVPNMFELVAAPSATGEVAQFKVGTLIVGDSAASPYLKLVNNDGAFGSATGKALFVGTITFGSGTDKGLDVNGASISTAKTGGLLFTIDSTTAFGSSNGSIAYAGVSISNAMTDPDVAVFVGSGATLDLTQSRFSGTAGNMGNIYLGFAPGGAATGDGNLFLTVSTVSNNVTNNGTWSGRGVLDLGITGVATNSGTVFATSGGTFTLRNLATFSNGLAGLVNVSGANSVLNLSGSTLNNLGTFNVTSGGKAVLGGVQVQTGTMTVDNGTIVGTKAWQNSAAGKLFLTNGVIEGSTLTSAGVVQGSGTINAPFNLSNTVTITGSGLNLVNVTNLLGGTFGGTTLNNFGSLIGSGSIGAAFNNKSGATLRVNGGNMTLASATAPVNDGTILVGGNKLIVTANWTNNGFVAIQGGSVRIGAGAGNFNNANLLTTGSSIEGNLTNLGSFTLTDHSSVTGNFTNTNTGSTTLDGFELRVQGASGASNSVTITAGTGTLNADNGFTNNLGGLLSLAGGGLKGGASSNAGTISGNGVIAVNVTNTGTVEASGGTLNLLSQNVGGAGTVRVASNGTLLFNGSSISGTLLNGNGIVGKGTLASSLNNTSAFLTAFNGFLGVQNIGLGTIFINSGGTLVMTSSSISSTVNNNGGIYGNGTLTNGLNNTGAFITVANGFLGVQNVGGGNILINSNGTLVVSNASVSSVITNNNGIVASGTLVSALTNTKYVTLSGNLTLSAAPTNTGTIMVGANKLTVATSWANDGYIYVVGGVIRNGNGTGLLTNNELLSLGSSIEGDLTNTDTLTVTNHSSVTGNFSNTSSGLTTLNGFELKVQGASGAANSGVINVGAGTLNATNGFTNNLGGLLDLAGGGISGGASTNNGSVAGYGVISADFNNASGATLTATGGKLLVTSAVFANSGFINIASGASLSVSNPWTNATGATVLLNGSRLDGATLTNNGTVQGNGQITAAVNNAKYLTVSGGSLTVDATLVNTGTIFVQGNLLTVNSDWVNSGFVSLANGTIKTTGTLVNLSILTTGSTLDSHFRNVGSFTLANSTTITGNFVNEGSASIGTHRLTVEGIAVGTVNTGTMTLAGGSIDSASGFTNSGWLGGFGYISPSLYNSGNVVVQGIGQVLSVQGLLNTGTIVVGANTLDVTTNWTNNGYVTVNGGSIRTGNGAGLFTNALYISTGSSINSDFSNTGTFDLTDHSSITGNFTNSAAGVTNTDGNELKVNGAAGVSNAGIINVDAGTLDSANIHNSLGALINLAGGGLKGTSLNNDGNIAGYGELDINAVNSGNIQATGGTLNVGAHSIGGLGGVDVASDGTLRMQGASISGGVNNSGNIVGSGTLVSALTNTGTVVTTANFHMETAPANTGTILVGAHRLDIGDASWLNNGWVEVHGGSIRIGGGAGLLTNALYISTGSSIDGNFTNTGSFELTDHSSITGNFNNTSTGWTNLNGLELAVQGALGATNDGTITVGSGTLNSVNSLVNSLGALITLAGGGITGGNVSNVGNIEGNGIVDALVNNVTGGGITASGGAVRFRQNVLNSGALNLGAGGAFRFDASLANTGDGNTGAILGGIGTYTFAPTTEATFSNSANTAATLGGVYDTRSLTFQLDSGILNVEVTSTDIGPTLTAIPNNGFSLGTLILPNTFSLLRLLDDFDNQLGGGQEAIYTENLMLGNTLTASNFNFGGASLKIYYNNIISGTGFQSARVTYFGNIIPINPAAPPPPPGGVVPEPSTVMLMLLGLLLLACFAWRRTRKTA